MSNKVNDHKNSMLIVVNGNQRRVEVSAPAPTKYNPEFNEELIAHLSQGFSFSSFPAVLYRKYQVMVSMTSLYSWCNQFDSFDQAKETGEACSLEFYEILLRASATGIIPDSLKQLGVEDLNMKAILFILATRFHKTYPTQKQVQADQGNKGISINIESDENEL